MGLLNEAHRAFRGRRFVEWLFMNQPHIPGIVLLTTYAFCYLQYKYDLIARWKGEPIYNDYSYVKEAVARDRARIAALSSSPVPILSPSETSSATTSSSSTDVK